MEVLHLWVEFAILYVAQSHYLLYCQGIGISAAELMHTIEKDLQNQGFVVNELTHD